LIKVFLIPGLGADARIFKNLDFSGYEVVDVSWIDPDKRDTLVTYAQKLIDHFQITPGSIVVGNSLGGMLAMEVAKKLELNKTILISSIKTKAEAPKSHKWYRLLPLYKLVPAGLFSKLGIFVKYVFGKMSAEDQWLFINMLENTPPHFAKWALGAILHWENQTIPQNVYHIHGDRDLVFPCNRIKDATIIKGGSHIMILNRAQDINIWLKSILPL
jgi:pimeloyl-ACP methyl ester carboxylesterase